MSSTRDHWLTELTEAKAGGAHDAARDGSYAVVRDAVAGHPGAYPALVELREAFRDAAGNRRGTRQLTDEWRNMVHSAIGKAELNGYRPDDPCAELSSLKATPRRASGESVGPPERLGGSVCLADLQSKVIKWLWRGMLPFGKLAILDGDPGLGKSVLTIDIIARVTNGSPMPGGLKRREPGNVIITCAEDDLEDTVIPRLKAARADLKRVFTFPLHRDRKGNLIPLTIPEDIARLRDLVKQNNAVLLVIDPITAYLSEKVNTGNDASTRRALMPLTELAADRACCILMVRHLNKDKSMSALYRGGGTMAFIGSARSGLIVGRHPSDEDLIVLAQTKHNLAKAIGHSFCFRVASWDDDPDIPVIEWDDNADIDADALMRAPDARQEAPAQEACWADMEELFAEADPWPAREMKSILVGNGHNTKTIERTRKSHDIRAERQRDGKGRTIGWNWTSKPAGKVRIRRESEVGP